MTVDLISIIIVKQNEYIISYSENRIDLYPPQPLLPVTAPSCMCVLCQVAGSVDCFQKGRQHML